MQILKIKLKNCYGIQNLEYDFNFTESKVYSLYAPNGFMKTSFSRAFSDLSANKDSRDLTEILHHSRKGVAERAKM
jgi:ABC-type molybdate transport system ATPase subunit